MIDCRLINLPFIPYRRSLDLMRGLAEAKGLAAREGTFFPEVLILAEHEPVVTLGRRATEDESSAAPGAIGRAGFGVYHIERGGLATYHGPGQIVAYPVFRLRALRIGVTDLVRGLEEAVIRTLAEYGIEAGRKDGHPGVWVGPLKIASIGLAVRRGVSFHGLALNHDPNLSHFAVINPCGLEGRTITSIARQLGRPVDPAALRSVLTGRMGDIFNLNFRPWTPDEARAAIEPYDRDKTQTAVAEA